MNESLSDKPKILVVDDRSENLLAMKQVLASINGEVVCVSSGKEALSQVLRKDFALILMDVQMPEMDGFDTATLMKANEGTKHIPIVFVTAIDHDPRLKNHVYDCGGVDYLLKPIDTKELLNKVKVFVDLFERRASSEEKNSALRHDNLGLQEFARAASHDLKAPVRHMGSLTSLLLQTEGDRLSEKGRKKLQRVVESSKKLQQLIDSFLSYAKSGWKEPGLSRVNLNHPIRTALHILDDAVKESGASVEVAQLPTIEADELMMNQVFQNLLSNAIKYRRKNVAPKIQIEYELCPNEEACLIRIVDNGIGFDPKYASRIFEPFSRLVGSSEYEGSGIGMATVRRIVDLHDGNIEATGKLGVGATLTLRLPLRQVSRSKSIRPMPPSGVSL